MWRRGLWVAGWMFVIALLCVFAAFQGGFFAWFLLYGVVGLFCYECLSLGLTLRFVQVERQLSADRLPADAALHVNIVIHRHGIMPLFWTRVVEELPQRWLFRTDALDLFAQPVWARHCTLSYSVPGLQRGVYDIGGVALESGDVFGMVECVRTYPLHHRVIIHPRVVDIGNWPEATWPAVDGGSRTRGSRLDATVVRSVRDYTKGDRLSRIHWPASARHGKLLAKEFESPTKHDFVLLVDVSRTTYSDRSPATFELALSIAASVLTRADQAGLSFSLRFDGDVERYVELDQRQIARCMDVLAAVEPRSAGDFRDWLLRTVNQGLNSKVVIVSAQLDVETASVVENFRDRVAIDWFVPAAEGNLTIDQERCVQRLRACGAQVYVYSTADLWAAREGKRNG